MKGNVYKCWMSGYTDRNFIRKTCKQCYKMESKTHTPLECQFYKETPRGHLKWKRIYKFIIFLVCLVKVALIRNLLQYIPRPICWLWCHIHINMIFLCSSTPKATLKRERLQNRLRRKFSLQLLPVYLGWRLLCFHQEALTMIC